MSSGRSNETIACKCLCCVSEAWPSCVGPSRGGMVSSCNPSLSLSSTRSTAPLTRAKLSLACGNERLISYAFLQETLYTLQYACMAITHLFWSRPRLGMSSSLREKWTLSAFKLSFLKWVTSMNYSEEFMWCWCFWTTCQLSDKYPIIICSTSDRA